MVRTDEIDIVASLLLQIQHVRGEHTAGNLCPIPFLADQIILAESASHCAIGEENRSGATLPDKWRLLAEMRASTGDCREESAPAVSPFAGQAVDMACARTECAGAQNTVRLTYSLLQFARMQQSAIRRLTGFYPET